MCIIMAQRAGSPTLARSLLKTAWERNSDGGGYAFVRNGELIIRKPFFKMKHMLKKYAEDHAAYGKTSPFMVHMRIATHGSKNYMNTHPHLTGIGGSAVLAHNGIINIAIPDKSDWSDTVTFCSET